MREGGGGKGTITLQMSNTTNCTLSESKRKGEKRDTKKEERKKQQGRRRKRERYYQSSVCLLLKFGRGGRMRGGRGGR